MGSVGLRLQNCRLSNFEDDSNAGGLESEPRPLAHTSAIKSKAADFFLRTPTLVASNFAALRPTDPKLLALKDLNLFPKFFKFQDAGGILRVGLLGQIDNIYIGVIK